MNCIAVLLNSQGQTASLGEKGFIHVFAKEGTSWTVVNTFPFSLTNGKSINDSRKLIFQAMETLHDCKIFIGKEVIGMLYQMLVNNGFSVYDAQGTPELFLNEVLEAENSKAQEVTVTEESPQFFIEKADNKGSYVVDMKKLLNTHPELTSKKLLLPFLKNETFHRLEILCDHVPKWFDTQLDCGLQYIANKTENAYQVTITPKV